MKRRGGGKEKRKSMKRGEKKEPKGREEGRKKTLH